MWGKKWPWRRSLSLQSAWSRSLVTKLTQTTFQKPLCVAKDPSLKPLDIALADLVQKLSQSGGITSSREQTESHREWANPVQSSSVTWQNSKRSDFSAKPCTPVTFPSFPCPTRDSRNRKGVFKHQALTHCSRIYRNIQAPRFCKCPLHNIACAFSTCQDAEVTASLSNEVVLWAPAGKGNRLCLHCLIHEIWVVCFFVCGWFFLFVFCF